jgi:acetylornithine deacetylase/succinyl-diaminopimelate desuccinylase-like protein
MRGPRALEYAQIHGPRFVKELQDLVRFPTVSSQPRHAADIRKCAAWLAEHLRAIGMDSVKVIRTLRHPLVYAAWERRRGAPTVLIYGHYDVQPADPLREWISPPFDAEIRGDDLLGRGACDDKGQMFAHVKALESFLHCDGALPVNLKCIFEGEEEIGSPHLEALIVKNRHALKADVALVSDTKMLGKDRPAISYAQRGALSLELEVRGPRRDLHSGNFGGAIHNPLQALCEIIGTLHDRRGRVAIPGFYDRVRSWSDEERATMRRDGPSDERILRDAGATEAWGEPNFSLYERTTLRPAVAVNGIVGGYQGVGVKAVIPAQAVAKLNFRLAPDQDPVEIERLFRRYIQDLTPPDVRSRVRTLARAKPVLLDRRHPAMRAAIVAYRKGFGATPSFVRSGGTIPVVRMFQDLLEIPTVLMGFALPDDRIHAPNEKFHLPNFHKGVATSIWFLEAVRALWRMRLATR